MNKIASFEFILYNLSGYKLQVYEALAGGLTSTASYILKHEVHRSYPNLLTLIVSVFQKLQATDMLAFLSPAPPFAVNLLLLAMLNFVDSPYQCEQTSMKQSFSYLFQLLILYGF